MYLLNDLEISLQLGQYEFGVAKPTDHRSAKLPFSQLTMHEKSLTEYRQRLEKRQSPATTGAKEQKSRPVSAFTIENPRSESRLHKVLVRRPKTAPTKPGYQLQSRAVSVLSSRQPKSRQDELVTPHITNDVGLSTASNSPRTFRSYTRENMQYIRDGTTAPSRLSTYSCKSSVLDKYSTIAKQVNTAPPEQSSTSTKLKTHKCHNIGPHTIHKNLNTITLGPNSDVYSVAGRIIPSINQPPVHLSAWYHLPNHYATVQKPHINLRVYAQRKKRLMHQRSQSSPLNSRFLNDHSNALHRVAQHESALDYVY